MTVPSFVERFDAFVLDLTEAACRRWQRLTGRTNIWLAVQLTNLSIVLYFALAGVTFLTGDWLVRAVVTVVAAVVLYGLTKTVLRVPIESVEASAYQRVMKGLRNPRRVRDLPIRLSFVGLSLLMTGPSALAYYVFGMRPLGHLLVVLTTVLLYVIACDPLPPAPDTARQPWGAVAARLLRGPAAAPSRS
jgi:hypothetical protein